MSGIKQFGDKALTDTKYRQGLSFMAIGCSVWILARQSYIKLFQGTIENNKISPFLKKYFYKTFLLLETKDKYILVLVVWHVLKIFFENSLTFRFSFIATRTVEWNDYCDEQTHMHSLSHRTFFQWNDGTVCIVQ